MFSFLKSEKLGTDCTRGFSNCALCLPELGLEILDDNRGTGAVVRGVDEDKFLFGKSFLFCEVLEAMSPKDASVNDLSSP